jgi:hypothetical protein
MRNDRRNVHQLYELLQRKVRVNLTSWEKRNIFDEWQAMTGREFPKNDRTCSNCIRTAIEKIARGTTEKKAPKETPILVKEKLVINEAPKQELTMQHTGAGWYEFSNGYRVRGKANAEQYLLDNSGK